MKKKNILIIICTCTFMTIMAIILFASSADYTTISEAYIPSETFIEKLFSIKETTILKNVEVERVKPSTLKEANTALEDAMFRQDAAMAVYEGLLVLGYTEDHQAVHMVKIDIENIEKEIDYYAEQQALRQEEHNWRMRVKEYPNATQAWLYMKNEFGWNDIVCAGIIGNLMAECGGCWTQDLDYTINSKHGMGMIQWIGGRKTQLVDLYGETPSLVDQLNFMKDELYGLNGVTKQVSKSQLDEIMNAESPEDCAYYFACYYERCAEKYRHPRRGYARTAYEYFVG
jgi:hypothetical protein